jgi:hypothetical protein
MGYARIVSGGPSGRYVIECDYGSEARTSVLAALAALLVQMDLKISEATVKLADATAAANEKRAAVQVATDQVVASFSFLGVPSAIAVNAFNLARRQLMFYDQPETDARIRLEQLQLQRADVVKQIAEWQAFDPLRMKSAWCTDYTEDASGYVATIDVNGESDLTLVQAGGRSWKPADGVMTAREIMSPSQLFFNAAIEPGWQKFLPTYRWGIITALNHDANTAGVSLFDAKSSDSQRLGINQSGELSAVPVRYMTCNSRAFQVGDRVVVEFLGQIWALPTVVGFLDNPKPCSTTVGLFYTRGYLPLDFGNPSLISSQDKNIGDTWDAVTAPTPTGIQKFMGWNDAVATLSRSDGTVTASITKFANYALAPTVQVDIEWTLNLTPVGAPYLLDDEIFYGVVQNATIDITITRTIITTPSSGAVFTSPAYVSRTYPIWSGWYIDGATTAQIFLGLTDPGADPSAYPFGPLEFNPADIVAPAGQAFTFSMPSSSNAYTVTGDASGTFPFPSGTHLPATATGIGSASITYPPTTWSATYP